MTLIRIWPVRPLSGQQILDAQLDGWTFILHYGMHGLQTRIHTKDFAAGAQLVSRIGQAAEKLQHHADLDLRKSWIDVRLVSGYDVGGATEVDVELARQISAIVSAAGACCESESISRLELGLDTPDHDRIAPFWAAVLDREYVSGDGWADGRRQTPNPAPHLVPTLRHQRTSATLAPRCLGSTRARSSPGSMRPSRPAEHASATQSSPTPTATKSACAAGRDEPEPRSQRATRAR